jgi:hypothetical protein
LFARPNESWGFLCRDSGENINGDNNNNHENDEQYGAVDENDKICRRKFNEFGPSHI